MLSCYYITPKDMYTVAVNKSLRSVFEIQLFYSENRSVSFAFTYCAISTVFLSVYIELLPFLYRLPAIACLGQN